MAYFKNIPPRPICHYCGKPVADEAWDEESELDAQIFADLLRLAP